MMFEAVLRQAYVPGQKFVQQHSGDWTMTGKVPVARVQGEGACVPFQIEKDECHPAYQDHGRIAGR